MNQLMMDQLDMYIKVAISDHHVNNNINIFDRVMERCQLYYDRPAHSLSEIKDKMNTKVKGDIFEYFSYKYLRYVCNLPQVWLLKELPDDHLVTLKLKRQDMGIDLVARDSKGEWYAIQAKYRKSSRYKLKNVLGWKVLSTFQAMVTRSGPWKKHIVITNAHYIRHVGNGKGPKDKSICLGTLQGIKVHEWEQMVGITGHILTEETSEIDRDDKQEEQEEAGNDGDDDDSEEEEPSPPPPPKIRLKKPIQMVGKGSEKGGDVDHPGMDELRRRRLEYYGGK